MIASEAGVALITPVILSGGSGTRLWPVSRPEKPKQLLALTAAESMIQLTVRRTSGQPGFGPPLIVCNERHAEVIEAQLMEAGETNARLILEPVGRNTAPAIALAAHAVADPATPLLIMPSDHVINDLSAFHQAVERALPLVRDGWLVTFGITPDAPETGYGYIRMGAPLASAVHEVEQFVEKPDLATARAMLADGHYAWNAGIFMFRADAYLAALETCHPAMAVAVGHAMATAKRQGNCIHPDSEQFAACPSNSIDYAVMEKGERVVVVPVSMGWSDVGSWDALHAINSCDENGNACRGKVVAIETQNCLVHSEGPRIALVGVEDLIVVATGDDILILPRGRSQEVRKVTEMLKKG